MINNFVFCSYQIMSTCWKEEPEERPTFDWLATELKKMSEDMQVRLLINLFKIIEDD